MSEVKIWHNPKCSKSREAKKILEEKNVPHGTFEYIKEDFTTQDIINIIKMLGISDVKEMLRDGEDLYKELDIKNKSQEEIIALLPQNSKLIQRPIIIKDGKAVIARPMENLINLLK